MVDPGLRGRDGDVDRQVKGEQSSPAADGGVSVISYQQYLVPDLSPLCNFWLDIKLDNIYSSG